MKISIIRGAFLNPYELQNYSPLQNHFDLQAVSSKHPISDNVDIPLKKLWSPTDLPNFPYKMPLLNRIFVDAQKLYGLEKILRNTDIAHVAETYYGYTHQAIEAKLRGEVKKIISTVWETIPHNNEGIKGRKEYKKLAYKYIDRFIAVTERAKECLIAEGVDSSKIDVINIGIDLRKFKPDKSKRKSTITNILCVARLVPEKGVFDLLEAFQKIREKDNKVTLTFVGTGPLKHDLEGYKGVYIKTIPYTRIHNLYQSAHIFCLPSRKTKTWEEQYGMALIEAMACGLPIVATDTGAIKEVCGEAALFAREANIDNLRTKLESLLYNKELRDTQSQISLTRAREKYDRLKIAKQIGEIYTATCQ